MSERHQEDEYFAKLDAEAKAKLRAEQDAARAAEEAKNLKAAHFNKCGKCGHDMATKAYRGIDIEECGSCGAVLLDPGELQVLAGDDHTDFVTSFFTMFGGGRSR